MSEDEMEINAVHTELRGLRTDLARLHHWAEQVLDREETDRQYIAEYLSAAAGALSAGDELPARPYAAEF